MGQGQDIDLTTGQPITKEATRLQPPWPWVHQTNLRCRMCGRTAQPFLDQSGPHIKASCQHCHAFIQFVPRKQNWLAFYHIQWGEYPSASALLPQPTA